MKALSFYYCWIHFIHNTISHRGFMYEVNREVRLKWKWFHCVFILYLKLIERHDAQSSPGRKIVDEVSSTFSLNIESDGDVRMWRESEFQILGEVTHASRWWVWKLTEKLIIELRRERVLLLIERMEDKV